MGATTKKKKKMLKLLQLLNFLYRSYDLIVTTVETFAVCASFISWEITTIYTGMKVCTLKDNSVKVLCTVSYVYSLSLLPVHGLK